MHAMLVDADRRLVWSEVPDPTPKAGDMVLIQAGASGLGMAAIQLAKAAGAKVMTTVGTPEKAAFVQKLGADIIINRRTGDLGATMDKNPVDIALDCVAGPLDRHRHPGRRPNRNRHERLLPQGPEADRQHAAQPYA